MHMQHRWLALYAHIIHVHVYDIQHSPSKAGGRLERGGRGGGMSAGGGGAKCASVKRKCFFRHV